MNAIFQKKALRKQLCYTEWLPRKLGQIRVKTISLLYVISTLQLFSTVSPISN